MELRKTKTRSILEELARNPEAALVSRDDAKCKAILSALGMLEALPKGDTPNYTVATSDEHKTHFVVGICWSGHPLPQQNGYEVFCLPKCQTSKQQLTEFVEYVLDATGGYDRKDAVLVLPDDWRSNN